MQTARALSWVVSEPEIMELEGRLDSNSASTVEEDALLCIQSGAVEMVLDCHRLDSITSAGMCALLTIAKEMKAKGGKLAISNLQPQVKAMIDACGYDIIIPICEDINEAMTKLAA